MTAHPINTEALAKRAGHILFTDGPEQPAATARETCVLLDLLAAVEAERDEWRQTALDERAAALDALEQIKVREARIAEEKRRRMKATAAATEAEERIKRLENRAGSETARANEWRRKHRVMAGKRDAARRAWFEEAKARREAETRIQAVRDVLDAAEDRGPIGLTFDGTPFPAFVSSDDIRRALEGQA